MEIDPIALITAIDGVSSELRGIRDSIKDLQDMIYQKLGADYENNLNVTVFVDEDEDEDEEEPKEPTKIEIKEA